MEQRWLRIEKLGLDLASLAATLEVANDELGKWLADDDLDVEQADLIEVGIAMLEMRGRARGGSDTPTLRLMAV